MILLDTHILVWWLSSNPRLAERHRALLREHEQEGILVSAISFWEVALLVSKRRLDISLPINDWASKALADPILEVVPTSPRVLIESTVLPGVFHPDPADRIIVATAREHDLDLLTEDSRILHYGHVRSIGP